MVKAVCFDDFLTLRYPTTAGDGIENELSKALGSRLDLNEGFIESYLVESQKAEMKRQDTHEETMIVDIVTRVLDQLGYDGTQISSIIFEAAIEATSKWKSEYYPDTFDTLIYLKDKGYKLGLISNTHWYYPDDVREKYSQFFDVITISYEHGYVKPHPRIFHDTMEILGVAPDECVHVGDNPNADIKGAHGAGMKTIYINRGQTIGIEADYTITSLSELRKIL